MASKIVSALLFVLGSITICFGETNFRGLEAGRSTRMEVEKTLGSAVREISATLSEYKSEKESEKIYVQYERDSNVAHRIELLYSKPVERSVVIGTLSLPPAPTASQVNSKGRLEEYFSPKYVVLTYATAEATLVSRLGFYSQTLFEKAIPKVGQNVMPPGSGPVDLSERNTQKAVATEMTCGRTLGSKIQKKWIELGGRNGFLGCPVSDESEAPAAPTGTKGRWAQFGGGDGGYIIWHEAGTLAGKSFEVHGCLFKIYSSLGGTKSWLGFPVSDEYDIPRGRRGDFEGGYIVWNAETAICRAHGK